MGLKSDKTFEDIVERLVALVDPQPAEDAAIADIDEDRASDQPDNKHPQPSAKTPFDQKKG